MRGLRAMLLATLSVLLVPVLSARAETKVELKETHLCCPKCVAAVKAAVKDLDGVKVACDQKTSTVTIDATDDTAAQKALDALAAKGFHGDTGNSTLKIKESGATAGKVTTLTLVGIHNCCGSCNKAIKSAIKKVDGVTADTAKPHTDTLTVTGNFDAAELVKALNAAGFHVRVQQ